MQGLVNPGADEPVTFTLDTTVTGAVTTTDGTAVTSKGDPVLFGADSGDVIGYADEDGSGTYNAGDRLVFRLEDNGDGSFTFSLEDQLDHADESGDLANLTLDLTGVFDAEDFDGDPVTLNADSICVNVENDVPTASTQTASVNVDEDELPGGITDSDLELRTATFTASAMQGLVNPGADEPVTFTLDTSVTGAVTTTDGTAVPSLGKGSLGQECR